jgi:aminoglycoside phosphotransferase (APT) family kinase protein
MRGAVTVEPTAELVQRLVAAQFPEWADLPVTPVPRQGWDNRTFRLGDELAVRLPSADGYVAAVAKEDRWLPVLARHLPLPVPAPVATGRPGRGYPFPWSVRRWLPGETLDRAGGLYRPAVVEDVGELLVALTGVPPSPGPAAGAHSAYRGCPLEHYDTDVRTSLDALGDRVDAGRCRRVWAEALAATGERGPRWFHGDLAVGNLLAADGRLAAVIDFGTCGVGDPSCDLVIAWTFFTADERQVLRRVVGQPDDPWRRARGWALWKALLTMAHASSPDEEAESTRVLAQVLDDPIV